MLTMTEAALMDNHYSSIRKYNAALAEVQQYATALEAQLEEANAKLEKAKHALKRTKAHADALDAQVQKLYEALKSKDPEHFLFKQHKTVPTWPAGSLKGQALSNIGYTYCAAFENALHKAGIPDSKIHSNYL